MRMIPAPPTLSGGAASRPATGALSGSLQITGREPCIFLASKSFHTSRIFRSAATLRNRGLSVCCTLTFFQCRNFRKSKLRLETFHETNSKFTLPVHETKPLSSYTPGQFANELFEVIESRAVPRKSNDIRGEFAAWETRNMRTKRSNDSIQVKTPVRVREANAPLSVVSLNLTEFQGFSKPLFASSPQAITLRLPGTPGRDSRHP